MNREEAIEELKAIKSEYSNKAFGDSRLMRSEIEALDVAIKAVEQEPVLDKIRAEIEERKLNSGGEPNRALAFNVCLQIIDKYKAESDHKCHTCKHYTSGEYDGSCDSYICEHYSGWESEE